MDVADRGRAAEAFEPAAPPTGGGKSRLDRCRRDAVGAARARIASAADSLCRRCAADSTARPGGAFRRSRGCHVLTIVASGVAAGLHAAREAHELHLGAATSATA